jgi:hypothetical protein
MVVLDVLAEHRWVYMTREGLWRVRRRLGIG